MNESLVYVLLHLFQTGCAEEDINLEASTEDKPKKPREAAISKQRARKVESRQHRK